VPTTAKYGSFCKSGSLAEVSSALTLKVVQAKEEKAKAKAVANAREAKEARKESDALADPSGSARSA
jgi:hypothetical protein